MPLAPGLTVAAVLEYVESFLQHALAVCNILMQVQILFLAGCVGPVAAITAVLEGPVHCVIDVLSAATDLTVSFTTRHSSLPPQATTEDGSCGASNSTDQSCQKASHIANNMNKTCVCVCVCVGNRVQSLKGLLSTIELHFRLGAFTDLRLL